MMDLSNTNSNAEPERPSDWCVIPVDCVVKPYLWEPLFQIQHSFGSLNPNRRTAAAAACVCRAPAAADVSPRTGHLQLQHTSDTLPTSGAYSPPSSPPLECTSSSSSLSGMRCPAAAVDVCWPITLPEEDVDGPASD